jgi:hypothetical protein
VDDLVPRESKIHVRPTEKIILAVSAGIFVLTLIYTGDIGLVIIGIMLTLLTLGFSKLEVKDRFKQEPIMLGFMLTLLFAVNCVALNSYAETYPNTPIAVIVGLMAWLLAVSWSVVMVTGRKKLFPIYVFADGMMTIFCLVPIIGIPLSLVVQ